VSAEGPLTPRGAPVADLAAAGSYGPYRVIDTLASNGKDKTFLAERGDTGARVDLRVFAEEPARESAVYAALREHVTRLGALTSRCAAIAAVHECGRADGGGIFVASEHVEGPTLAEVLRREARLPPERAVRLTIRIAEALESAHMLGVSHGGLTPERVVLQGDDSVKLTQFGVDGLRARGGGPGATATPYAAPELSAAGDATPQGDVYAVGAMLYQSLAGRPPEPQAAARRRVSVTPLRKLRTDVTRTLEHVVNRALEPDPERRYRDMTDFFNDLWSEISPFSNGTPPPEKDAMRRGRAGKGRSRTIAVGIVLGAIVVIAGVSRFLVSEPPTTPAVTSPPREPAPRPEFATPITGPAIPSTPALSPPPAAVVPTPPVEPPPAAPATPAPAPPVTATAPPARAPSRPPVAAAPAKPSTPPARPTVEPLARPVIEAPQPAPEPPRAVARPAPRPAEPGSLPVLRPETPARDSGDDGGAIIDWLLKESAGSRR
jgi:serine/threonine-protein kinase